MTTDLATTISAIVAALCGLVVVVFPGATGDMLRIVIASIGAAALAIMGWYSNRGGTVGKSYSLAHPPRL